MFYATLTLYCLVGCLLVFIILHYSGMLRRDKVNTEPALQSVPVITKHEKEIRKPAKRIKKVYSPKPMTPTIKYLYSIKPNIGWWIDEYGHGILDKTIPELKGEQLFQNDNGIDFKKRSSGKALYSVEYWNWKNSQLVKRLYERARV
jgi:hypothetical protein